MDGGHVDDGAAFCRPRGKHRRNLVAHPVEDTVEVDADDLLPGLEVGLAGGRLQSPDAGVVDRQVQASVGVDGMPHHLLGVRWLRRVLLDRRRGAAGVGDLCVTRSAPAKLMSLTITLAPLVASSLLIASPRPEPPPVTIATFPSKSDIPSASLPVVADAQQSRRPDVAV